VNTRVKRELMVMKMRRKKKMLPGPTLLLPNENNSTH